MGSWKGDLRLPKQAQSWPILDQDDRSIVGLEEKVLDTRQ